MCAAGDVGIDDIKLLKEDSSINFRPSPNFKHMKKYLKSKFEEDVSSTSSESNDSIKKDVQVSVQPPLPPNSPPLDWPQPIVLKKELLEDDEFQQIEQFVARENNVSKNINNSTNIKKKTTLCKDFFRKKCIRGAACNFSHEIIPEQMEYVYKFCIDFENRKCKRPACGYVHATTSEKERFINTGELPPHVFDHLKKKKCEPAVHKFIPYYHRKRFYTAKPEIKPAVYNQPPPMHFNSAVSVSAAAATAAGRALSAVPLTAQPLTAVVPPPAAALPVPAAALPVPTIATATALTSVTTVLHEYGGDLFKLANTPPLTDMDSQEIKSCNNCDITLMKFMKSKTQLQMALKTSQELDKSIDHIDLLNRRYQRILKILLKSRSGPEQLQN
ncbi:hypothetical protein ACJJTC_000590 [Scirpophaga incertulas]